MRYIADLAIVLVTIVCGAAVGIPVCVIMAGFLQDKVSAFSLERTIHTMIVAAVIGALLGAGSALFLLGKISKRL